MMRLDGAPADVADGAEAEADPLLAHDGELEARLVHVRRQHLEAQLARLVDVLHHLVGVADFRRQQRRHELGRVVRLEPRRLVATDRVRHRVRLVEAVAAEGLDLRRQLVHDLLGWPSAMARSTNLPSSFLISSASFLPTAFRSTSASARVNPASTLRDPHHLFLIGDDAVRGLEHLLQRRVRVGDLLLAAASAG